MKDQNTSPVGVALRALHEAVEMRRGPFSEPPFSPSVKLDDCTFDAAKKRAAEAVALQKRIAAIEAADLPDELALALRLVKFDLTWAAREADWYWLVFMPGGFPAMFAPTSYCGGSTLIHLTQAMGAFEFARASDRDRYLGHLSDIARMIEQFTDRTRGQAERGIYMPKPQLAGAVSLLDGLAAVLRTSLAVDNARLGEFASSGFENELKRRIDEEILPAMDRFKALLGPDYADKAPERVGLSQYPGGAEVYAELVKANTTMNMSPEEVHEAGLARMRRVRAAMAKAREDAGFDGSDQEYRASLNDDPAWRAHDAAGIEAVFQRYIDRLKPKLIEFFDFEAPNPYGVARLAAALEPSMTFGYYDMPRKGKERGEYLYNAANLTKSSVFNLAALNYHELVPGHHLHISVQKANDGVHPLHNFAFYNAFNEGWAEYSATLAGEAGAYEEPAERFGRLVMDAFLTSRLVVDTGMNAFGWSLERARAYMRENSFMPEKEICSESLRYSCDIPAQALAYKLGDTEMLRLRDKMREKLGNRFDIRDFHRAVLHPGGMPLPDLEWHIDRTIERIAARQ